MIPKAQLKKADEATPVTLFDSPKLAQQKLIQKLSDLMDDRYKKFLLYGALEGINKTELLEMTGHKKDDKTARETLERYEGELWVSKKLSNVFTYTLKPNN